MIKCSICQTITIMPEPRGWFQIPIPRMPDDHREDICPVCTSRLMIEVQKMAVHDLAEEMIKGTSPIKNPDGFVNPKRIHSIPIGELVKGSVKVTCPIDDCEGGQLLDGRRCPQCDGKGTVEARVMPMANKTLMAEKPKTCLEGCQVFSNVTHHVDRCPTMHRP